MRNVVLNHISSIRCCNPLGQTNPMLDSTTVLENGNFGFPYSFLPRFPPLYFLCSRVFHSRVFSRPIQSRYCAGNANWSSHRR